MSHRPQKWKILGVKYMFANAGMHLWEAEDYFYIIRGGSPFDTLLELKVRAGKGGDRRKNKHFMETEIEVKDVDADGINEIVIVKYEGENERDMKQVTQQPEIYCASFKLTTYSFEHLRKKGLPEEILQGLQPLEEQEFAMKSDFLNTIEQQIGEENTKKYERLLVQYGISQYRLESGQE